MRFQVKVKDISLNATLFSLKLTKMFKKFRKIKKYG